MAVARKSKKDNLTDHNRVYAVVSNIANTPSGLTFGQLRHGDTVKANKELSRLLATRMEKKMEMVLGTREDHGRQVLKVPRLTLYGIEDYGLMDSGVIPNLISKVMENACV